MMSYLVFPITVNNTTAQPIDSQWTVRPLKREELAGNDPVIAALPKATAPVQSFGLIIHRCDELVGRESVCPTPRLELTIASGAAASVALVVDLAEPLDPAVPVASLFNVEEERPDGTRGGVVIVVTSVGDVLTIAPLDLAPRPLPLILDTPLFFATSPVFDSARSGVSFNRAFGAGYIGALVRNAGPDALRSVSFWLECCGVPGARWDSRLFELEELEPGGQFFAACPIDLLTAETGRWRITFACSDTTHDVTRLSDEIAVFTSAD